MTHQRKPIYKKGLTLLFFLFSLSSFFNSTNAQALPSLNAKYISYSDSGQGEVLVLIHAFPADKTLWLPQQMGLRDHFRIISLDLWGFGHSEGTTGYRVTMANYADQVAQLLDQLYIKKAIIAGESMGGYVALTFLKKYPDRVKGLVLSNTQAIADNSELKKNQNKAAIDVLVDGSENLVNDFMDKALAADSPEQNRLVLQNMLMVQSPFAIASALRGMSFRKDLSQVLAHTTVPVLIITSDKDLFIPPQQSANMHALAKNSRLVVINDAGHLSNLEQPEQWNHAVIAMFKGQN